MTHQQDPREFPNMDDSPLNDGSGRYISQYDEREEIIDEEEKDEDIWEGDGERFD